jgi:hypothetical protein
VNGVLDKIRVELARLSEAPSAPEPAL